MSTASAHQPILLSEHTTKVFDPEISKAYYTKLSGKPDHFFISSQTPFILYLNVLTPYHASATNVLSATIWRSSDQKILARLDGEHFLWKKFFEPFAHDDYWMGPEFRESMPAGEYEVVVSSPTNQEKYALAIGEKEAFTFADMYHVLLVVPDIKRNFFDKSPLDFLLSIVGATYFVFTFAFSALVVFLMRRLFVGRLALPRPLLWTMLSIGLIALLATMLTTWHPIFMFLSSTLICAGLFLKADNPV